MRSFRHGVSIRLASITRERIEWTRCCALRRNRVTGGWRKAERKRIPGQRLWLWGSIVDRANFLRLLLVSIDRRRFFPPFLHTPPPPQIFRDKRGIMLELVERKAGGISWPSRRGENLDSVGKDPKEMLFLGQRDKACPRGGKRWKRKKGGGGGLLCSLGQLRCNHTYYTPDTLGTWKFHRVSRPRR